MSLKELKEVREFLDNGGSRKDAIKLIDEKIESRKVYKASIVRTQIDDAFLSMLSLRSGLKTSKVVSNCLHLGYLFFIEYTWKPQITRAILDKRFSKIFASFPNTYKGGIRVSKLIHEDISIIRKYRSYRDFKKVSATSLMRIGIYYAIGMLSTHDGEFVSTLNGFDPKSFVSENKIKSIPLDVLDALKDILKNVDLNNNMGDILRDFFGDISLHNSNGIVYFNIFSKWDIESLNESSGDDLFITISKPLFSGYSIN